MASSGPEDEATEGVPVQAELRPEQRADSEEQRAAPIVDAPGQASGKPWSVTGRLRLNAWESESCAADDDGQPNSPSAVSGGGDRQQV